MSTKNIGNLINQRLRNAFYELFAEGEAAQLTFSAFEKLNEWISHQKEDNIKLTYPIGYRPDHTSINSTIDYKKDLLIGKAKDLSNSKLALNSIYHIVTIIEALFGDLIKIIIAYYPKKIGNKRSIRSQFVLECKSIEEVHLYIANVILNEIAYKSPKEFAEESKKYLSVNLLECPAYHKYIETKATRDIYIHNSGIVNETYLNKAGSHSRAKLGFSLPVDVTYFLESYEACLQIVEWLEKEMNDIWPSSDYEKKQSKQSIANQAIKVPELPVPDLN